MKPLRLQDLLERLAHLCAMDTVLVEEDAAEDGVVQGGASFVVRGYVEPTYVGCKPDATFKDFSTSRHRSRGLRRIGLQARPLLAEFPEPFPNLVLR